MSNRRTKTDWTEDEARDLLAQGYSPRQVAKKTGFKTTWVEGQRVPKTTRLQKALAQVSG